MSPFERHQQQQQQNPYGGGGSSIYGWGDDDDANNGGGGGGSTTTTTTTTMGGDSNMLGSSGISATVQNSSGNGGGNGGGGMATTTVIVENTTRWADWGLTIPIALLFPLFAVKLSETAVPVKSCVNALVADWDSCDAEVQKNADIQYFLVLIIGIVGLIVSLVMTRYRISSRPALLGLSYGSMLCLLYAVFANTHRINSTIQIAILGIILVGFIFLPRVGGSLMGD